MPKTIRITSAMKAPWRCNNRPNRTRLPEDAPPGVATVVVIAASCVRSLEPQGDDYDGPLDHLGDLLGDAVSDERVLQQLEHHGADHGAPDGHLPAGQRRSGDCHGGDRVELHSHT